MLHKLPPEILTLILLQLPLVELCRLRRISSIVYKLTSACDQHFWKLKASQISALYYGDDAQNPLKSSEKQLQSPRCWCVEELLLREHHVRRPVITFVLEKGWLLWLYMLLPWNNNVGTSTSTSESNNGGWNVNETSVICFYNYTLFSYCCAGGWLRSVCFLVEEGYADVNKHNPLHEAVRENHLEVAAYLLEHGALPDKYESCAIRGVCDRRIGAITTPLVCALFYGNEQMARLLLQHGASPCIHGKRDMDNEMGPRHADNSVISGPTPLWCACYSGLVSLAIEMLDKCRGIRGKEEIDSSINHNINDLHDGRTPLMLAVEKREIELVRALLMWGADPNVQNTLGYVALHLAVAESDVKMCELLCRNGARVNVHYTTDGIPCSPLQMALQCDARVRRVLKRWKKPRKCFGKRKEK